MAVKPATTYPLVLGTVLAKLRERRQLTQGALARGVDVNQSTWSKIENGASALTMDQLARVANTLRTRPEQIIGIVTESVSNIEKNGIKVELLKPSQKIGAGYVAINSNGLEPFLVFPASDRKARSSTGGRPN